MSGMDADPGRLHASASSLAGAADEARPGLAAATAGDCASGFPGTATAAYEALIAAWKNEDTALVSDVHSLAGRVHQVADDYVATDLANSARLQGAAGSGTVAPRPVLNM